jgi:hypothetical protein
VAATPHDVGAVGTEDADLKAERKRLRMERARRQHTRDHPLPQKII